MSQWQQQREMKNVEERENVEERGANQKDNSLIWNKCLWRRVFLSKYC